MRTSHSSPILCIIALCALISLWTHNAFTQTVHPTDPLSIDICAPQTLSIGIVNNEGISIDSTAITFLLNCNITYVPGSVTGASEVDLSDLSNPVFVAYDLAPADSISVVIEINVNCEAQTCAEQGITQHFIRVWSPFVNNEEFGPGVYNIAIGKLVIVDIETPVIQAAENETVSRIVTIRNTRVGRISEFTFTDQHNGGILVNMDKGFTIVSDDTLHSIKLAGSDFSKIGNKDKWFDFTEEIAITETITIITCPFEQRFVQSDLTAAWGCDSAICQGYKSKAQIYILTEADVGNTLEAVPTLRHPECLDVNIKVPQSLLIEHEGELSTLHELTFWITNDAEGYFVVDSSAKIIGTTGTICYKDLESDLCGQTLSNSIVIELDSLLPGQKFEIVWDVGICPSGTCGGLSNTWEYHYSYTKDCAPADDRYVNTGTRRVGEENVQLIAQDLTMEYPLPLMQKGDTAHITHEFSGYNFTSAEGTITLEYRVDCDLEPIDQTFILDGQTPQKENIFGALKRRLLLTYQLPLSSNNMSLSFDAVLSCDSLCTGPNCLTEPITSCPKPCAGGQSGEIEYLIQINNEICIPGTQISSCGTEDFKYKCLSNTCPELIPGYLDYKFTTQRINFGLPDNDDDHIPDATGQINHSQIAIHNVIQGDTFATKLFGEIIMDDPDTSLSFGLLTIKCDPGDLDFQGRGLDKFDVLIRLLGSEEGFRDLNTELIIKDLNQNITYILANIPESYDPVKFTFYYDLNPLHLAELNPGFPADFTFENGDSVYFSKNTLIEHNLIDVNKGNGLWMDVNYSTKAQFDTKPIKPLSTFSCYCHEDYIRVVGFTHFDNKTCCTNISFCATDVKLSEYSRDLRVGVNQQLFPYEIRAPYIYESVTISSTRNLLIDSAVFFSFNNQAAVLYPVQNIIEYDFSDLPSKLFDEELNIEFETFGKRVPCSPYANDTVTLTFLIVPRVENGYFDTLHIVTVSDVPENRPQLSVNFEQPNLETESEKLLWDFTVTNNSGSVVSDFTWLALPDLPPIIRIDSLIDTLTGQSYYPIDGIYQLGALAYQDTVHLQLHATMFSCRPQSFTVRIGTHCATFEDPYARSCLTRNTTLTLTPLTGTVELDIISDEQTIQLCSSSDYIVLRVNNADKGVLRDLTTELRFPAGMSLLPGTAWLRYPAGSNVPWEPIMDPVTIGTGTIGWEWESTAPAYFSEGLPGAINTPDNGFEIRLKVTTDCAFTSGLKPQYATHGIQSCGDPTKVLARVSGTINIEGLNVQSGVSISKDTFYWSECVDSIFATLRLSTSDSISSEDLISVILPTGYTYLTGSAFIEPTQGDGLIIWALDTSIQVSTLSFTLISDGSDRCGNDYLTIYTSVSAEAYCLGADSLCTIQAVSGFAEYAIYNKKPVLNIQRFESSGQYGNYVDTELDIINASEDSAGTVIVDIYLDLNYDGIISAADTLLSTQLHVIQIGAGQATTILFDSIPLPDPFDACRLIAMISSDKNCICSGDYQPINIILQVVDIDSLVACSGDTINVGVPAIPGLRYRWTSDSFVECDTCPKTVFFAINNGQNPIIKELILQEIKDERCAIEHQFLVTVPPNPSIITPAPTICFGNTIVLLSTEGTSYKWEGQNIISQDQNEIIAKPDKSGYYSIQVQDTFGCTASDSIFVKVLAEAIANAGADSLYCYGQTAYLFAAFKEGLSYHWLDAQGIVENPSSPVTRVLNPINHQFVLEVDNGLCQDYDTVEVAFYDAFDISGLPDSTALCDGEFIEFHASGANSYQWVPFYSDMCLNDSCSDVLLKVHAGLQPFYVHAVTFDGCKDTTFFEIYGDVDTLITLDTTICDGEAVNWKGYHITESGIYCDTVYVMPCPDYTCLTVEVIERDTSHIALQLCPYDDLIYRNFNFDSLGEYYLYGGRIGLCDSVIHITVYDEGCFEANVYIPNVFSPNGDDINDLLTPSFEQGYHIEVLQFQIYNRWGEVVFSGNSDYTWDGMFKGRKAAVGVYVYYLEIKVNGALHKYSGDVTVL